MSCLCRIVRYVKFGKVLWFGEVAVPRLKHTFSTMSAKQALQIGTKTVRPVLSLNKAEAKRRVLNLYKAWYRQVPYLVKDYDIPKSEEQCRAKLREFFENNKGVTDVRVIDLLVIKGQMELQESVKMWKQKGHIMHYFKPTEEPKPKDFLSKFFSGVE